MTEDRLDRESLLEEVNRCLLAPIREETQLNGDVTLVGGDPGEVIVRISGSKVAIAVYSVRWESPHSPVTRPKQLATLNCKRLPGSAVMISLHGLISAAVEIRRAKYRKCGRCGGTNPPEWIHDEQTCQSCAEKHLGVVH